MAISCHSRSVSYGHRRASSFLALSAIRTEGDSRYLRRNWKTSRRRSRNASSRSTTLKKLAGKCTSMSVAVPCVQEDQPIPKTRHSSTRISMARNSGLWYFGSTFNVRRSTFDVRSPKTVHLGRMRNTAASPTQGSQTYPPQAGRELYVEFPAKVGYPGKQPTFYPIGYDPTST